MLIKFNLYFLKFQWIEAETKFYSNRGEKLINTGSEELDQTLTVLLSTSTFIGGFLGFILDNTIPGNFKIFSFHYFFQKTWLN